MRKLLTILTAAFCLVTASAHGQALLVDFDSVPGADGMLNTADDEPMAFPDGSWMIALREQLAPTGIHFTAGTLFNGGFFDGNPANNYLSSTYPDAYFDIPVFGISIESHSYWDAQLTAYDHAGNVLVVDRIFNPGHVLTADMLSVVSAVPIYRFTVTGFPTEESTPILNLDNMVLTLAPVPEPSQFALMSVGVLLLGATLHRRSRQRRL